MADMPDSTEHAVEKALDQFRPSLPEAEVRTKIVRAKRFRKLRIAWSVGWGLLAVLLIVLWVRSYWQTIEVDCFTPYNLSVACGRLILDEQHYYPGGSTTEKYRGYDPLLGYQVNEYVTTSSSSLTLRREIGWVPLWAAVLAIATIAAVPWIRWSKRFSLRTLLIATTLAAVVLGLIVAVL
jgi:hypothetical protein